MDKTEKFWDKVAVEYHKDEERFKPIQIKVEENTRRYLKSSDTILDFGCGIGTKTLGLRDQVHSIKGIDISSKMIELARKNALDKGIENVEFIKTPLYDQDLGVESYNGILAFNILHVLDDH